MGRPTIRRTEPRKTGAGASEQQVRERAYRIYQARMREGVPGDPVSDWLRAEQELRPRRRR